MVNEYGFDTKYLKHRLKDQVLNFTNYYGTCQQLFLSADESRKMTYMKFKKLTDKQADLIHEPNYSYGYEFDQAEVFATTWERTKIQFVNQLAFEWGGKIKERALKKCYAPVDSSELSDVARC